MANFKSFLKIFKKKKNQNQVIVEPEVGTETNGSQTKPKQLINSGLKSEQNSGFQSKTPQKLNQKFSDPKTSKSQTMRKLSIEEKERRIELVGNYLKNEIKPIKDKPIRPKRRKSKDSFEVLKPDHSLNEKESKPLPVNRNKMNLSLDSIIEMNVNRVIKNEEKLLKTGNQLKANDNKNEVNNHTIHPKETTKDTTKERHSTDLLSNNSINDFVDKEFAFVNNSQTNLQTTTSDRSQNSQKVVSGLVSIREIDLKTAKCVVCYRLFKNNINITICSHLFCAECMRQWIRFSQHCPQCRAFISSFGHSIRTQFNRICIRSEKDYKVTRVSNNFDNFVDSLGAAYLFEAFSSNREVFKYLDSNIAKISAKISELEAKLTTIGSVQMSVNIRYAITEESHRLDEFKLKKRQSEESFKEICNQTNPKMISFWKQVLALRVNSNF